MITKRFNSMTIIAMNTTSENGVLLRQPLWLCILVVLALYILQGVTLGVTDVVPLYLASFGATWKQLSIFSFVMYPFSVKLLWAPLIDVFYVRWLGRRRTWLLPTQLILSTAFIILSFYFESLLTHIRVTTLTIIFSFVIFLTATQDICVDGWALTLFGPSNIIWQSISQMVGHPVGGFLGSSILLTFESANMTNRLMRQPLGIADQPYGLFTLAQFLRFWGVVFLIITFAITLLFREQRRDNDDTDQKNQNNDHLDLLQTYLYIIRLFKKKCFRELLVILIGSHIGHTATAAMTLVVLIRQGLIKRETLGLITIPLILIKVTIPFLLSRTRRPLIFYAQSYIPRLILCIFIALFVYFSPQLHSYSILFYTLFILLLGLSDALVYLQGAARGGFLASISDPRIGSTYYTLLASLNNLGMLLSSSAVLYSANWLPKEQAYFIEVGVCILLGCVWLCFSWRLMYRLQATPIEHWHLSFHKEELDGICPNDHQIITANTGTERRTTNASEMRLASWL